MIFSLQKCNKHNGVVDNRQESMQERWPGLGCGSCWLDTPWALSLAQHKLGNAVTCPEFPNSADRGRRIRGSRLSSHTKRVWGQPGPHETLSQTNQKKMKVDIPVVTGRHSESNRPHCQEETGTQAPAISPEARQAFRVVSFLGNTSLPLTPFLH